MDSQAAWNQFFPKVMTYNQILLLKINKVLCHAQNIYLEFISFVVKGSWEKTIIEWYACSSSYRLATISSGYSDVESPRTFQSRSARSGIVPVAFKPRSISNSPRRSSDSAIRESIDSRASKLMSLICYLSETRLNTVTYLDFMKLEWLAFSDVLAE